MFQDICSPEATDTVVLNETEIPERVESSFSVMEAGVCADAPMEQTPASLQPCDQLLTGKKVNTAIIGQMNHSIMPNTFLFAIVSAFHSI